MKFWVEDCLHTVNSEPDPATKNAAGKLHRDPWPMETMRWETEVFWCEPMAISHMTVENTVGNEELEKMYVQNSLLNQHKTSTKQLKKLITH